MSVPFGGRVRVAAEIAELRKCKTRLALLPFDLIPMLIDYYTFTALWLDLAHPCEQFHALEHQEGHVQATCALPHLGTILTLVEDEHVPGAKVREWDVYTGKTIRKVALKYGGLAMVYHAGEVWMRMRGGAVNVYKYDDWKLLHRLKFSDPNNDPSDSDWSGTVKLTPSGSLVIATAENCLHFWKRATLEPLGTSDQFEALCAETSLVVTDERIACAVLPENSKREEIVQLAVWSVLALEQTHLLSTGQQCLVQTSAIREPYLVAGLLMGTVQFFDLRTSELVARYNHWFTVSAMTLMGGHLFTSGWRELTMHCLDPLQVGACEREVENPIYTMHTVGHLLVHESVNQTDKFVYVLGMN